MFELPKQFGRYTLSDRIASGGMATLYLGRLVGTDGFVKIVAVKVIHEHLTEDHNFVKMFINEARVASRIAHPNVVQTIELGRVGTTHYIAMEFVNGESVSSLLRRTKPELIFCARIIADAAAGLHAAHTLNCSDGEAMQVVHRDVSPENILISYGGGVKISDFGVARARDNLQTTRGGEVKGKYAYMAPEQIKNTGPVDHRADVFALGIVLFEMTTYSRLFKGETGAQSAMQVVNGSIPLPSQRVADYPIALEQIVLRALERDVDRRYQSAQELQEDLERFMMQTGEPVMQSHVGQLMTRVFEDRIAQKRELIRKCEQGRSLDTVEIDLMGSAYVELGTSVPGLPKQRRGPALLVGVVAALVAVAALAVFFLIRSGPSAVATSPDTKKGAGAVTVDAAPVKRITIFIHATPQNATIFFDGRAVGNPFELRRPQGKGELEAVVSAAGYTSRRLQIPLTTGGRWLFGLQRQQQPKQVQPTPPTPKKPRKKPHKKWRPRPKPKKKGLGDKDVTSNPYNR